LHEARLRLFDQALADDGILRAAASKTSAYFARATEEQRGRSEKDATVPDGLAFNNTLSGPSASGSARR